MKEKRYRNKRKKKYSCLFSLVSKDIKQKNGKWLAHIKERKSLGVAGCMGPSRKSRPSFSLFMIYSPSSVLVPIAGLIWEQFGCSSQSLYPLRFRYGGKVWLLSKSAWDALWLVMCLFIPKLVWPRIWGPLITSALSYASHALLELDGEPHPTP